MYEQLFTLRDLIAVGIGGAFIGFAIGGLIARAIWEKRYDEERMRPFIRRKTLDEANRATGPAIKKALDNMRERFPTLN